MVNLSNYAKANFNEFDINLVQKEVDGGVEDSTGHTSYFFLCKGKKKCVAGKDDERFNRYPEDFKLLLKEKRK